MASRKSLAAKGSFSRHLGGPTSASTRKSNSAPSPSGGIERWAAADVPEFDDFGYRDASSGHPSSPEAKLDPFSDILLKLQSSVSNGGASSGRTCAKGVQFPELSALERWGSHLCRVFQGVTACRPRLTALVTDKPPQSVQRKFGLKAPVPEWPVRVVSPVRGQRYVGLWHSTACPWAPAPAVYVMEGSCCVVYRRTTVTVWALWHNSCPMQSTRLQLKPRSLLSSGSCCSTPILLFKQLR
jgi:hypothetical protein